ncbi:MAG: response regulator [Sulfurospirillaceae bacterium]|nr:response regulator [Sulfurospirillaceae bacterium]
MKSVVIIDDHEEMATLLERFFKRFDAVDTKTFSDPERGLSYLQANRVDLVVSDITMPKLDGIALLKKIKEIKPELQVIMITAEASLDRVLKSHKYDAEDFLLKPVNLHELERKVKKIL